MSRESDAAYGIEREKLEHEEFSRTVERMHNVIIFGSKSLATINGAGVVAMLAFIQALVEKPSYLDFRAFGIISLICFLSGSFLATVPFFAQYLYINRFFLKPYPRLICHRIIWVLLSLSAICVLAGGITITIGIIKAL